MTRTRFALLAVLVLGLASALTVGTWAATRNSGWDGAPTGYGHGMMGGGMMGGRNGAGMMGGFGVPGNGQRVTSLDAARARAQTFAESLELRTGEVLQFSNGFYAELLTTEGAGATEVLVDPTGGGVAVEYGPAMMWNTSYGMHAVGVTGPARVTGAEAARLAQRWLDGHHAGWTAGEATQFPGYFTMETRRGETITGMMSVNAYTGAVWYHTWHGSFVAASEE
jgi:hypothetical protein